MDAIEDIVVSVEVGDDLVMSDVAPVAIATIEPPERHSDTSSKRTNNESQHETTQHAVDDLDGTAEDIGVQEQLLDEAELQLALESESRSIPSHKPRLHPIEVVLTPPSNPDEYEILSPSFVVDRVLEEVRIGDDSWFSVEYSDGRIEQVSASTISRAFFIRTRKHACHCIAPSIINIMLFVTAEHVCLERRKGMMRFVRRVNKCALLS